MRAALSRRIKGADYMYSPLTSKHFLNSRNVLEEKARLLKEQEKGKRPNKSCSLSNDEMEQLWQSSQFGYHSSMGTYQHSLVALYTSCRSQGTPRASQHENRRFHF